MRVNPIEILMRGAMRRSDGGGERRGGKFKILPIVIFAIYALYYLSANQEEVPLTGRSQLVAISANEEAALGLSSYQQILRQSDVISSGRDYQRIQSIGQKLADVFSQEFGDKFHFEWDFNLIKSEQINAFALPGGKVAVYTGIIPVAENDNALAAIMGHEIGHVIARHGAERMSQQQLLQMGQLALSMSVSEMSPEQQRMAMGALGIGSQFGVMLPFSRKHESEADYLGLIFMSKACFDPREAPKLWERMAKASGGKAPVEFMSTHPNPETRIEQFKEWMPEAIEIYNSNCS